MVDSHLLIQDLVAHSGGNVRNRVIARLLELARVLIAILERRFARPLSRRGFLGGR